MVCVLLRYDWCSSVYVHIGIGGFLPLLVQVISAKKAGFPLMCPNVIFNETLVRSTFPQHNWATVRLDVCVCVLGGGGVEGGTCDINMLRGV